MLSQHLQCSFPCAIVTGPRTIHFRRNLSAIYRLKVREGKGIKETLPPELIASSCDVETGFRALSKIYGAQQQAMQESACRHVNVQLVL